MQGYIRERLTELHGHLNVSLFLWAQNSPVGNPSEARSNWLDLDRPLLPLISHTVTSFLSFIIGSCSDTMV